MLEPIGRRIVGQRHLQAAVAENQHVSVAGIVQRRRFEVKIKGAVLEIGIVPAATISEVTVRAVPLSLASEDGPGLQPIGVGSKHHEKNNSYVKRPLVGK